MNYRNKKNKLNQIWMKMNCWRWIANLPKFKSSKLQVVQTKIEVETNLNQNSESSNVIPIACNLINRLPSFVLVHPIYTWFHIPKIDLFPLPQKVFGSICFLYNNHLHRTKLDPHAFKSVFLRCPCTQRGYIYVIVKNLTETQN